MDRDGTVTQVLDGLSVPNGPAFTADGRTMYLADSPLGRILRHRVDPETGDVDEGEVFATVESGSPDGMAVDQDGGLWSAAWGAGVLHHYRADGRLDEVVPMPVRQPAGLRLGGADGRTLFVTSAHIGLDEPGPLDGALLRLRVAVPGPSACAFRPDSGLVGQDENTADEPAGTPCAGESGRLVGMPAGGGTAPRAPGPHGRSRRSHRSLDF
ncbi:SMP-30/gluconolactonase/LRE family protein [Streptomyces sp. NPDC058695]|uniref:SMP-30/gluconolactonase/LRE family protein n=1 Tax=Streptomyces sp. NPDC058695 TaxID=3346604 RepID=UPI00365A0090